MKSLKFLVLSVLALILSCVLFVGCSEPLNVYFDRLLASPDVEVNGTDAPSVITPGDQAVIGSFAVQDGTVIDPGFESFPMEESGTEESEDGPTPSVSEGLDFRISDDGSYYTVVGIGECTDSEIVLPARRKGLPVRYVGEGAFSGGTQIIAVVLPASIEEIGDSAFAGCTNLANVELSEGLKRIESSAFAECVSLRAITIPESVAYIGFFAFAGCDRLGSVSLTAFDGWCYAEGETSGGVSVDAEVLVDSTVAAEYLSASRCMYCWMRGIYG